MWLWCPSEEAKQTNRNYFVGWYCSFLPFQYIYASERRVQNNQLSRVKDWWMLPLPTTLAFKCRLLQGITNEQGKTRFCCCSPLDSRCWTFRNAFGCNECVLSVWEFQSHCHFWFNSKCNGGNLGSLWHSMERPTQPNSWLIELMIIIIGSNPSQNSFLPLKYIFSAPINDKYIQQAI